MATCLLLSTPKIDLEIERSLLSLPLLLHSFYRRSPKIYEIFSLEKLTAYLFQAKGEQRLKKSLKRALDILCI
jgi:hypothetical protein